ncbi:hypothetical protein PENANT_c004G09263 [Penicillium antarcticum]|uniref:Uncharacterized protein n=1 Tax=Penicillium antarcticum TaxID=416450 RepID=A0A1V6QGC9_9EURO|nr:hypothetical protein PENANT_c004G09263 [Penicillium antarcticum]
MAVYNLSGVQGDLHLCSLSAFVKYVAVVYLDNYLSVSGSVISSLAHIFYTFAGGIPASDHSVQDPPSPQPFPPNPPPSPA